MTAPTIAATVLRGLCTGGCGLELSREPIPEGNPFARIANELPLLCDACCAEQEAQFAALAQLERDAQARITRRQQLGASGIPRDLRHVDLNALDPAGCASAIDCAHGWARLEIRGLLLTGPFGTGKTTIAAGALRLLLAVRSGRWASAPALLAMLSAGFGTDQQSRALDLLSARHALVLDDIDKTRPTEYGAEQVFLAVDNCVTRGQQLLVTTNLSVGHLAAKWPAPFGEAIASRLVGYCAGVEVHGRDRRIGGTR